MEVIIQDSIILHLRFELKPLKQGSGVASTAVCVALGGQGVAQINRI